MAIALRDAAVETNGRAEASLASDASLTTSALAGDEEALGRLLTVHERSAYNVAYRLLGREADAKDAVQEAFILTLRAVRGESEPPHTPDRFRAWLLRTVTNASLGLLRRRPRAQLLSTESLADDLRAPEDAEPMRELESREARAAVFRALLALPDAQRAALTLREYEGMSYEEIAATLGLTHAAVETLLFRARRAFRAAYEGLPSSFEPVGCPESAPLLSAMIDGELAVGAWRNLSDHLHDCPHCRQELAQLRRTRRLQALIPALAVPEGLHWAGSASGGPWGLAAAGSASLSWLSGLLAAGPGSLVTMKAGAVAVAVAVGVFTVAKPIVGQELPFSPLGALWASSDGRQQTEAATTEPAGSQSSDPTARISGTMGASPSAAESVHEAASFAAPKHGEAAWLAAEDGAVAIVSGVQPTTLAGPMVPADAADRAAGGKSDTQTSSAEAPAGGDPVDGAAADSAQQLEGLADGASSAHVPSEVGQLAGEPTRAANHYVGRASGTARTVARRVLERPLNQVLTVAPAETTEIVSNELETAGQPVPISAEPVEAPGLSAETLTPSGPTQPVTEPIQTSPQTVTTTATATPAPAATPTPAPTQAPKTEALTTAPAAQSAKDPKLSTTQTTTKQTSSSARQTTRQTSKTTQEVTKIATGDRKKR